jgi:hypothetical protein
MTKLLEKKGWKKTALGEGAPDFSFHDAGHSAKEKDCVERHGKHMRMFSRVYTDPIENKGSISAALQAAGEEAENTMPKTYWNFDDWMDAAYGKVLDPLACRMAVHGFVSQDRQKEEGQVMLPKHPSEVPGDFNPLWK